MKVVHSGEVAAKPVEEEGARAASVQMLLSKAEGAPNFAMRLFELGPGGATPLHEHEWEHEVFLLKGQVEVVLDSGPVPIAPGDAVLVMPGERHRFRNVGEGEARFLCVIPH